MANISDVSTGRPMRPSTPTPAAQSALQRLGPIPYWRGEEKFIPALDAIYKKAMAKAHDALKK